VIGTPRLSAARSGLPARQVCHDPIFSRSGGAHGVTHRPSRLIENFARFVGTTTTARCQPEMSWLVDIAESDVRKISYPFRSARSQQISVRQRSPAQMDNGADIVFRAEEIPNLDRKALVDQDAQFIPPL